MSRLPDWLLERALVDEVPPQHAERVLEAIARPDVAARMRTMREQGDRLLADLPPAAFAAEIERRRPSVRELPSRRRWVWLAPLAAGVAALALFLIIGRDGDRGSETRVTSNDGHGERVKGTPHLVVHRQRGEASEPLAHGDLARKAELLQVSYVASGARYGVIVSIDGRGVVTLHLPEHGESSAALSPRGRVALPHSYELDDAPGFERFFFITSAAPFRIEAVTTAARALARDITKARTRPLMLTPDLTQQTFLLRKGTVR
jgi:hypothetical protein